MIRRGKFGPFIACGRYPDCDATHSIPPNAMIKIIEDKCPDCKYHMLFVIRSGKRPWKYCINKDCPKKVEWRKQQEELKKKEAESIEKEFVDPLEKGKKKKATKKKSKH